MEMECSRLLPFPYKGEGTIFERVSSGSNFTIAFGSCSGKQR